MAIDREKAVQRLVGVGMALAVVGVALLLLAALSGCEPAKGPTDPCPRNGCTVPIPTTQPVAVPPLYVPQCHDVDTLMGPCVDQVGDSKMWIYIAEGNMWPAPGTRMVACKVETGGPVPCVWVVDKMGEHPNTGDSGAYVYLVGSNT